MIYQIVPIYENTSFHTLSTKSFSKHAWKPEITQTGTPKVNPFNQTLTIPLISPLQCRIVRKHFIYNSEICVSSYGFYLFPYRAVKKFTLEIMEAESTGLQLVPARADVIKKSLMSFH